MIIVIKANAEYELNQLAMVEKLPDGVYIEVDDSGGHLAYSLFKSYGGKREEVKRNIIAKLSLADSVQEFCVEYIILTAKTVDVDVFTGGLLYGNLDCMVFTTEEFLAYKASLLN